MWVDKTGEYGVWLDGLKDRKGKARILVRVDRLVDGNSGQHRHLSSGVAKLKIDFGLGYRACYGQWGTRDALHDSTRCLVSRAQACLAALHFLQTV